MCRNGSRTEGRRSPPYQEGIAICAVCSHDFPPDQSAIVPTAVITGSSTLIQPHFSGLDRGITMKNFFFAVIVLLSSSTVWADWLVKIIEPEFSARNSLGECLFDEPLFLKIKANGGDTLTWFLTTSNDIQYPISFSIEFNDSFKGLVPIHLPQDGFHEWVGIGRQWRVDLRLVSALGEYYKIPDPIFGFYCPYQK